MSSYIGRVLVYGGKGALGKTCVSYFKTRNWWVGSLDLSINEEAHSSVVIPSSDSWVEQESNVTFLVESILQGEKLDAIICVAGGWAGGSASSNDLVKNCDLMWKQSVWTSVIASKLAVKHLKEGGLLSLTGAKAALDGTSGMIGYGLAKGAVHQLVKSLGQSKSGLPNNALAVAILPITLDTPMNRKFMPNGDFSTWTPLEFVAELLYNWTNNKTRPPSGSLVQLITSSGKTDLIIA